MKIFILFVVLFCLCFERKSTDQKYIKIEHIGERDKPIATLIISTKDMPKGEWEKVIIVNEQSFNGIYGFVSEIRSDFNLKDEKVNFHEWEVFRVTGSSTQGNLTFITSRKSESIVCFTQLGNKLQSIENQKGVKSLIHELEILLKRIG